MTTLDVKTRLREVQHASEVSEMVPHLLRMPVVEVGELLMSLDNDKLLLFLDQFSSQYQGLIVADFPMVKQLDLFKSLSRKRFSVIFEFMPSDIRADIYQHLTQQEQTTLLPFLPKSVREDVISLSAYPPETAGGTMSTDFATILQDMTCEQAIEKVRLDAPSKRTIYYIYVTDSEERLKGFVTLKDLILAAPTTLVRDILHSEYVCVSVEQDREEVASVIEKYDLVAVPVVNKYEQLVGIITHDDAIEIIRAEHTEDMEKFMGIVPDSDEEANYATTTAWQHFRKRVVWIVSLAALGIVSGLIIHSYESTLEKLLILALYMPMVADTGGNSGSQAATVIVRALALGHVSPRQWLGILWKEARISSLLAICLGVIAFGKVLFLSWETEIPAEYSLMTIAFAISLALALQVITATVIGAGLPLLVKKFGGDPAVAASPAITTIVDVTGLLIYFSVVTFFFAL